MAIAYTSATGTYADRAAGERDNFKLSIVQNGSKFCGSYETTAKLGNHVDDGYLDDWTFQARPNHTFQVHYHLGGSVGKAMIRAAGDKLLWSVLTERATGKAPAWAFSAPKSATLIRQSFNHPDCEH